MRIYLEVVKVVNKNANGQTLKIRELHFKAPSVLVANPESLVTSKGFRKADQIKAGDIVYANIECFCIKP